MVYIQNFELGIPVEITLRALLPSNFLKVDYCCVSYLSLIKISFLYLICDFSTYLLLSIR